MKSKHRWRNRRYAHELPLKHYSNWMIKSTSWKIALCCFSYVLWKRKKFYGMFECIQSDGHSLICFPHVTKPVVLWTELTDLNKIITSITNNNKKHTNITVFLGKVTYFITPKIMNNMYDPSILVSPCFVVVVPVALLCTNLLTSFLEVIVYIHLQAICLCCCQFTLSLYKST